MTYEQEWMTSLKQSMLDAFDWLEAIECCLESYDADPFLEQDLEDFRDTIMVEFKNVIRSRSDKKASVLFRHIKSQSASLQNRVLAAFERPKIG